MDFIWSSGIFVLDLGFRVQNPLEFGTVGYHGTAGIMGG